MNSVPYTFLHSLQFLLDHVNGCGPVGTIDDAAAHAAKLLQTFEDKLRAKFNELLADALSKSNQWHKLGPIDVARMIDEIRAENQKHQRVSRACASYAHCDAGAVFTRAFSEVYGFDFVSEDELCQHIRHACWVINPPESAIEKLTDTGQIRTLLNVFDDATYGEIAELFTSITGEEGVSVFVSYRSGVYSVFAERLTSDVRLVTPMYTLPKDPKYITWPILLRQVVSDVAALKQTV